MQGSAKPAKVQRDRVSRERPRLWRPWLRRIVFILIAIVIIQGINYQTVEKYDSIAAKLLFERTPDDAVVHGFSTARHAVRKRGLLLYRPGKIAGLVDYLHYWLSDAIPSRRKRNASITSES